MNSDNKIFALDLTAIEAKARQLRAVWIRDLIFGQKAR